MPQYEIIPVIRQSVRDLQSAVWYQAVALEPCRPKGICPGLLCYFRKSMIHGHHIIYKGHGTISFRVLTRDLERYVKPWAPAHCGGRILESNHWRLIERRYWTGIEALREV